MEAVIEAILFTMGESVELKKIAAAIEHDEATTRKIIHRLQDKYEAEDRGLRIIELEDSFQLCTKREMYDYLIRIAKQPKKCVLTDVLLETLSIIAYRQPVTKLEIEKIRGVKSDHAVNKLVEQLLQYKMYKYMSYELRDRELDGGRTMYKDPTIPEEVMDYVEPVDLDELLGDLTLATLNRVFQDVIRRQEDKIDPVRSKFGKLEKEEVTVEEKLETVTDYAREHKHFSFRTLLGSQKSKMQTVVTFLAVLQLIKEGILIVQQEHAFDDIMITANL